MQRRRVFVERVLLLLPLCILINCRISMAEDLSLPATGMWNGFLRHINVIECSNVASTAIDLSVGVRRDDGSAIGNSTIHLPPHGTGHLILNQFAIVDAMGTYTLSAVDEARVTCFTAIYRFPIELGFPKPVEYAFALPVRNPLRGDTAGIFNSFNPSAGPQPVWNWLSVLNPGTTAFSATIVRYALDGTALPSLRISELAPGRRIDVALGHDAGQIIGLYRIRPDNSVLPYEALITRYSSLDTRFNFAFPLRAMSPTCDSGALPASTMDPATNWGELANVSGNAVRTIVEIRDRQGTLLNSGQTEIEIGPYQQYHIYLNQYLGWSNVGSISVRCASGSSVSGPLLLQSMFYGHLAPGDPAIEWAYASQQSGTVAQEGDLIVSPINTFLGAANWNKLFDRSGSAIALSMFTYGASGELIAAQLPQLPANGSLDLDLHSAVGRDAIGVAESRASTSMARTTSELLRVYPRAGANIGYIMNIPSTVVTGGTGGGGSFSSCSDGVDNDGNGLIDYQDFGCFGPNESESVYDGANYGIDSNGWTHVTPSADSRIVYVSSGSGDDNNSGLSPDAPVRTIAKGHSLLRHQYPDWLLLKRGDTWMEAISLKRSGRNSTERLLIGSYGLSTERPLLKTGSATGMYIGGGGGAPATISNVAIVGLHFRAHTRVPNSPEFTGHNGGTGILYLRPGEHLLIEDVKSEFYWVNFVIQAEGGGLQDFVLRRSISVDAYGISGVGHSQGLYMANCHGVLIEENLFDHNGWAENGPAGSHGTIFNHNLYIQGGDSASTNVAVKRNIIARASSHGLQLRPGGEVVDNLFLKNSLHMFVAERPSTIIGNVVLDAKDIDAGVPRAHGIEVLPSTPAALLQNNIVSQQLSTNAPWYYAYAIDGRGSTAQAITMVDNIAYNWRGRALSVWVGAGDIFQIARNAFQENRAAMSMIGHSGSLQQPSVTYSQNNYFSTSALNQWFNLNDSNITPQQWLVQSLEQGATLTEAQYVDPSRTVATYHSTLGGQASLEAFLNEARRQSKIWRRREYTALPVIQYVRAGFVRR